MTQAPLPVPSLCAASGSGTEPAQVLTRRLAAAGFGVHSTRWRDRQELIILNVTDARSCLTLTGSGWARWHYEPHRPRHRGGHPRRDHRPHPRRTSHRRRHPRADTYQAFPLKGKVGRCLQDRGLTVTLHVYEDWESFEATTDIEVTSPARPWLGTIQLADTGHLDWQCDYRAAFHGDPGQLADVIIPILRTRPGSLLRTIPGTPS